MAKNKVVMTYPISRLPSRIITVPNLLTLARMILLPFLIYSLSVRSVYGYGPAVKVGILMIATDLLDGFIARKFNQHSKLGSIIDPMSDKIIIATLGIYFSVTRELPQWVALFIVIRELLIITMGTILVIQYKHILSTHITGRLSPLIWGAVFIFTAMGAKMPTYTLLFIAVIFTVYSTFIYIKSFIKAVSEA